MPEFGPQDHSEKLPDLFHEDDFDLSSLLSPETQEKIREVVVNLVYERLKGKVDLNEDDVDELQGIVSKIKIFTTVSQAIKFRVNQGGNRYSTVRKFADILKMKFSLGSSMGMFPQEPAMYLKPDDSQFKKALAHELSHIADQAIAAILENKLVLLSLKMRHTGKDTSQEAAHLEVLQKELQKYLDHGFTRSALTLAIPIGLMLELALVASNADINVSIIIGLLTMFSAVGSSLVYELRPEEVLARQTEQRIGGKKQNLFSGVRKFFQGK